MSASGFTLRGQVEMSGNLSKLIRAVPGAVPGALYRQGQKVLVASQPEVPVDTGTLRSSGFVEEPKREGNTVSVTLGYGGAAESYAAIVHEDLEAHHPTGGAKYLERPLYAAIPSMGPEVADDLREAIKASV